MVVIIADFQFNKIELILIEIILILIMRNEDFLVASEVENGINIPWVIAEVHGVE
jgi:hypothetical protein